MQCKDIPDKPILEFLNQTPDKGHNWFKGSDLNVGQATPEDTPDKLLLAKMRQLIR